MMLTEKMMIKQGLNKFLRKYASEKKRILLTSLLMIFVLLSSCNFKDRQFFEPTSGLIDPNDDIELEAPVLVNPLNGATGLDYMQIFEWNPVESATIYELQLAEAGQDFMQGMQFEINTNSFEFDGLELQTDYNWRVRAGYEELRSPWSDIWGFRTMEPQKLDPPQLVSPQDGATGIESPVQFNWNAVSNAEFGYTFHLSPDNSFSELLFDEQVDNTGFELSNSLEFDTPYYWRVKANGGEQKSDPVESDWSDVWMFRTAPEDIPPPGLTLLKTCIEHGSGVSYIKLLWELDLIDAATAANMVMKLNFTGPGTNVTLEASPNQDLLLAHILQISSYGLYVYQLSQVLLNDEPIEFTGNTSGEVDVDSDEQNPGECNL